MLSEILNSHRLSLEYLRGLVLDVSDGDFVRQPVGLNHPAWIVGHLAFSCQAIAGELGLPFWLPPEWNSMFGTGSIPTPEPSRYPSKDELLRALEDASERVVNRLREMGDDGMGAVLPDKRHRAEFPTIGHVVLHIVTGHFAVHVGQLSAWRRVAGYAPVGKQPV